MTGQSLGNITEHPKIAVTQEEYNRISRNLTYYQSKWPEIEYLNSNHEKKKRSMNHLPIARTASKKLASLVFNEQAEITVDDTTANNFIQET